MSLKSNIFAFPQVRYNRLLIYKYITNPIEAISPHFGQKRAKMVIRYLR